jgi:hypothetical protein
MSAMLFIGTFFISISLKNMRTAPYFPTKASNHGKSLLLLLIDGAESEEDLLRGSSIETKEIRGSFD